MPSRIEDALNFPVVKEVLQVAGEVEVRRYIEFELIKLANLVSVGGNLNNAQVVFIAQELIATFPNETLADFKLCFQRGAIGQYGEIFRLDGIVIRGWMGKYLEEKYQVMEDSLMREKEDYKEQYIWPAQTITDEVRRQQVKDRLQTWKEAIEKAANERPAIPMSEADINKEGQIDPRPIERYKDPHSPEWYTLRDKILRTASEFYRERYTLSGMQLFRILDHEILAESESDAVKIYEQAKEK